MRVWPMEVKKVDVNPNDLFQDKDPRMGKRRVRVICLTVGKKALCENTVTGRRTRIAIEALRKRWTKLSSE